MLIKTRLYTILLCLLFINSNLSLFSQRSLPATYSGTAPINYVRTWDAVKPTTNVADLTTATPVTTAKMTTQYLDGLGRPIQTVVKQGSLVTGPSTTPVDMIDMTEYDEFGREVHKYLPTPANNTGSNTHISDGLFKLNPFAQQQSFYNSYLAGQTGETPGSTTNWAYSKTNFEASPLNRPLEGYAPGVSWVGSESTTKKSVKSNYWINTATDAVRIWTVTDGSTGSFGTYATTTTYPAGELYKNATEDEHGKQVIEFKDKSGLVILKKVQLKALKDDGITGQNHDDWLCTYYIYDDLNRLRAVIQPEGVKTLSGASWTLTSTLLDEQTFRYEYDHRSRMIMKKVPGAGEVYMVYDQRDRLIMSQDANMRTGTVKWLVTKYDVLNRPVETGILNNNTAFTSHLTAATAATPGTYPNTASGYDLLTQTFYDNYDWLSSHGNPFPSSRNMAHDDHLLTPDNNNYPYPQAVSQSNAVKGLVTGTKIKVLNSSTYLYGISYYDNKGRVIQTIQQNITGAHDYLTTQYDFVGKPLIQIARNEKNFTLFRTDFVKTSFEYDVLGRLVSTKKKPYSEYSGSWKGGIETQISKNEYNALGQLKTKVLAPDYDGGDGLETLAYDYNIRGWLLGVNKKYIKNDNDAEYQPAYFGFELGYDKQSNNSGTNFYHGSQYNGNIAGMVWKSMGDAVRRKYDFRYDAANRLGTADFTQNTNAASGGAFSNTEMDYSVFSDNPENNWFIRYDDNGNILNMVQRGFSLGKPVSDPIDNLKYTYIAGTNRLKSVVDFKNDPDTKLGDFRTAATHSQASTKSALTAGSAPSAFEAITDYSYDVNGNLTADGNKAISAITYNHLNLPQTITVTGKGTITYTYDAVGNKLKKTTTETNATVDGYITNITTTTTYIGGSVYESKTYSHASLSAKNQPDKLLFIGMEEGRIRYAAPEGSTPAAFHYDYMLKDHLGNVRMVLTEEQKENDYLATMEEAVATYEEQLYANLNTRENKPAGYPVDNTTDPNNKAAKVNGSGNKIGPALVLKVMAGDKINLRVSSWYKTGGASPGVPVNGATDLVNAISEGMAAASGGKAIASQLTALPNFSSLIGFFMSEQKTYSSALKPRAYVSWIAFDEQFNYEYQSSGFEQVGDNEEFKPHVRNNLNITKNGYIYIYVSNETPNIDVFFDNLQVTHTKGPILEETHYYPFGLTMASISSKTLNNAAENKNEKFQGQPLDDDLGLGWYGFRYRNHDPQIGRFIEIDPLSEEYVYNSTYAFSENKVTNHVELEGLESVPAGLVMNNKGQHHKKDLSRITLNRANMLNSSSESYQTNRLVNGKAAFISDLFTGGKSSTVNYITDITETKSSVSSKVEDVEGMGKYLVSTTTSAVTAVDISIGKIVSITETISTNTSYSKVISEDVKNNTIVLSTNSEDNVAGTPTTKINNITVEKSLSDTIKKISSPLGDKLLDALYSNSNKFINSGKVIDEANKETNKNGSK